MTQLLFLYFFLTRQQPEVSEDSPFLLQYTRKEEFLIGKYANCDMCLAKLMNA